MCVWCVQDFWRVQIVCVCCVFKNFWWVFGPLPQTAPFWSAPPSRPPLRRTAPPLDSPSTGPPKNSLFFFLSRRKFHPFFSLWGSSSGKRQNSTRRPPRERRMKFPVGERKKKARNFGPPTLRAPTTRPAHPTKKIGQMRSGQIRPNAAS